MSVDLWISIALAIPLAIIANLFTPRFQRWLDSRLERSKKAKIEKREKARNAQLKHLKMEFEEVSKYYADKTELNLLFLVSLVKVAMYSALGTVYGALFPMIGETLKWEGIGGVLGRTGAQVTALLVSMLIFVTCSKTIKMYTKVRDFDEYKRDTDQLISELEQNV
ncbi:TPA: hypothetical protein ACGUVT_004536 [Vibrio vulnificus]